MLTEQKIIKLENGKYFNRSNLIGKGMCGDVYIINEKYVVKKLAYYTSYKEFKKELETTIILSIFSISPKVVYHSKKKDKFKFFVMERLDHTLYNMLKYRIFTENHLTKLNTILTKLSKTKYRHADLHLNNIMWSETNNQFYVIDWGYYYISSKKKTKNIYEDIVKRTKFWMCSSKKVYTFFGMKFFKIGL